MKHYYRYHRRTRLSKLEEKRQLNQAFLYIFLSIILLISLVIFGIPMLVKLSVWFGNYKSSLPSNEKKETIAPNSPTFAVPFEATNTSKIPLKGYAEEKSTVKIIVNGQSVGQATTNSQGAFLFRSLTLKEGTNSLKAKAINTLGKESEFSQELQITLDTQRPELTLSSPKNGSQFFDKDREIEVRGITEKDALVLINDHLGTVDSQGNFSLKLELKSGSNPIKVLCRDLAGNETFEQIEVSYSP